MRYSLPWLILTDTLHINLKFGDIRVTVRSQAVTVIEEIWGSGEVQLAS
jgi:hypothetical protein